MVDQPAGVKQPQNPPPAINLEGAILNVANKVAAIVSDFSKLTVETRVARLENLDTGLDNDTAITAYPLIAMTEFNADGDATFVVPVQGAEYQVHSLYDLHRQQVETALKYRADMIASVVQAIQALANRQG